MEIVSIILILLFAVVLSSALTHMIPIAISAPLIQIGVGALMSSIANFDIILRPELFFFLFLPPLLFLDGWRIPKEGLARDKWTILQMAFGLVFFTVLIVGMFLHWMIAAMPLSVAFALAAIMSPTDPVAVSAIAARIPVPKRLMHILEGESLFNDASGLVTMRFAVAAVMGGSFSILVISVTFLWMALAGLAIGIATTVLISWLLNQWIKHFDIESSAQIVISLLIPFIAYLIAEHIHASGILAAVSAGIAMSFFENRLLTMATTRIRSTMIWDMLQFVANGVVFIILGQQLPQIISNAQIAVADSGHEHPIWLLFYTIILYMMLISLRFLWGWISLRFTLAHARRKGITKTFIPGWRLIAVTSIAGVRGTITLAGVLTLPLFLPNGDVFPARDLAIFLAAAVIILSLLIANISLPWLLHNLDLPANAPSDKREEVAQQAAIKAAIDILEKEMATQKKGTKETELYHTASRNLIQLYQHHLTNLTNMIPEPSSKILKKIETELHLKALQSQRDVYIHYKKQHKISEETLKKNLRSLDLIESRLMDK